MAQRCQRRAGRSVYGRPGEQPDVKLSYSPSTGFTRTGAYTVGGTLHGPEGVAVDGSGRIYVADSEDDEVVILDSTGSVENTMTGLTHPSALEIAPNGDLYVANTYADWSAPTPSPRPRRTPRRRPARSRPPRPTRRCRWARHTVGHGDGQPGRRDCLRGPPPQLQHHLAAAQRHLRHGHAVGPRQRGESGCNVEQLELHDDAAATGGYFMQLASTTRPATKPDATARAILHAGRRSERHGHPDGIDLGAGRERFGLRSGDDLRQRLGRHRRGEVKLGIKQNSSNLWWNGTGGRRSRSR